MREVSAGLVWIGIALLAVAGAGLAAAPDTEDERERQVGALFACVSGVNAPGAAVLVAQDGKVLVAKGYGYANVEHHVPITPQTRFRLASVTKSTTALAILQLQEAGRLSLEDPLAKYLPDLPNSQQITLRHLLTHTSGMSHMATQSLFSPGTRLEYSNAGYRVLGQVIEKVSGQSYEQYLREHIWLPLGMYGTGMDRAEVLLPHRASGYVWDPKAGSYRNAPFEDAASAGSAGGLYATVEDLYRLDRALDRGALLRPETVAEAFSPAKLADGSEGAYGLGWALETYRGLREVDHGGDITGFNTQVSKFPDQHLTVIVLSNVWMRPQAPLPTARALAHSIADIYLAEAAVPEAATRVQLTPEQLRAFAGRYKMTGRKEVLDVGGDVLTIEVAGDHLVGSDRVNRLELVPESDTTFALKTDRASKLLFRKEASGVISGVTVRLLGLVELQGARLP